MDFSQLAPSHHLIDAVMECAQQAVILTDRKGRIQYVNPASAGILGFSPDELTGQEFSLLATPEDLECMYPNLFYLAGRGLSFSGEIMLVRKNRSRFFAFLVLKPVDTETVLISLRDIDCQKRLAHACDDGNYRDLVKIAEGIAHELRNPLVGIGGAARHLRKACVNLKEHDTYYSRLFHNLDRIESLVKKVESYSRLPLPEYSAQPVSALIEAALHPFAATLQRRRISVENAVEDTTLFVDRNLLARVFSILLQNALDAVGDGGKIHFYSRTEENRFTIVISDDGCGISEDDISFIFNPFFSTKPHGDGIDLSMVKRIVESHAGTITVSSQPGRGTSFSLVLPLERRRAIRTSRFMGTRDE